MNGNVRNTTRRSGLLFGGRGRKWFRDLAGGLRYGRQVMGSLLLWLFRIVGMKGV